jgi:hypothetical protein
MQFLPLTIFLLAKWALANSKGHPWKKCQRKIKYLLNLASISNYLNPEKKKETKWKIRMGSRVIFHISHAAVMMLSRWLNTQDLLWRPCLSGSYTVWMAAVQQIRRFSLSALKVKIQKVWSRRCPTQYLSGLSIRTSSPLFCFGWRA